MTTPRKRPETEVVKTTVRVDRALWDAVLHRCIDEKLSAQEIVERALRAYLKKGTIR